MGATTIGRLLYEIALDEVVAEPYARKSLAFRCLPLAQMTLAAVGVVVLSVLLGRL
jgi:hypothetical protein